MMMMIRCATGSMDGFAFKGFGFEGKRVRRLGFLVHGSWLGFDGFVVRAVRVRWVRGSWLVARGLWVWVRGSCG